VLHVNCRSFYNNALELWSLVDTCNSHVVIGTESWLKEDISNAEIFSVEFTTLRRDRSAVVMGFLFVLKYHPQYTWGI
jgi:hypothetical protein